MRDLCFTKRAMIHLGLADILIIAFLTLRSLWTGFIRGAAFRTFLCAVAKLMAQIGCTLAVIHAALTEGTFVAGNIAIRFRRPAT